MCIFQKWPPFDIQWPLVTTYNFWGQNDKDDVGQGYSIRINTKNWVTLCIFQIWTPIDLLWPHVTCNDLQGQLIISHIGWGYNKSMYTNIWIPESIWNFCSNWPSAMKQMKQSMVSFKVTHRLLGVKSGYMVIRKLYIQVDIGFDFKSIFYYVFFLQKYILY